MKIDKEIINRVEKVARLNLSNEEKEKFVKYFKDILEMFSKLKDVDTSNIDISVQPIKVENVFREDKVKKSISQKEAFSNSEHKEKEYFKGPRIL